MQNPKWLYIHFNPCYRPNKWHAPDFVDIFSVEWQIILPVDGTRSVNQYMLNLISMISSTPSPPPAPALSDILVYNIGVAGLLTEPSSFCVSV